MNAPARIASANPIVEWWRNHVTYNLDRVAVLEKVAGEAHWNGRYAFMTLMSAGIAVLGLLLSSPAVVIGAMLISPLMGPIIGLGFGLATFDSAHIRQASLALALGVVLAVLFSALVVLMSPLQNVTEEIAARTRPNLFDLMVALFSALAGAYAMIRGREGTVVGVAIATALMPPLSVMGFGLATANTTVLAGSTLLFFTNLMTIAVAAAVMARLYGFGSELSPKHTLLQSVLVILIFVAFAIPLGLALRQIAWEASVSRQARDVITSQFGDDARLSQVEVLYDAVPLRVDATVLTPEFEADADSDAAATLSRLVGRPVQVRLEQYRVGTGAQAEAAQIASAQASARQLAAEQAAAQVTERLALVAGVAPDAVLLDRDHARAVVTAARLPDAGLASYRALEGRVAAAAKGWTVTLVPPALPLPAINFEADEAENRVMTGRGQDALATAIWGAKRLNLPVAVTGSDAEAEQVLAALGQAGIPARRDGSAKAGSVSLAWAAPGSDWPESE